MRINRLQLLFNDEDPTEYQTSYAESITSTEGIVPTNNQIQTWNSYYFFTINVINHELEEFKFCQITFCSRILQLINKNPHLEMNEERKGFSLLKYWFSSMSLK